MEILWLEDNPDRSRFVMELTRYHHNDWRYTSLHTPIEAIALVSRVRYDVVVSDLSLSGPMPMTYEQNHRDWYGVHHRFANMRGLSLWRTYRHPLLEPLHPISTKGIPLIVITAYACDSDLPEVDRWTVPYDMIPKPIDDDRLRETLEAVERGDAPPSRHWRSDEHGWSSVLVPGEEIGGESHEPLLLDIPSRPKELEW